VPQSNSSNKNLNQNPLISIVMPAYNSSKTIKYSIESIINQSYKNWELLIVNDCSSDNTLDIIYEYTIKDRRIKLINQLKNQGVAKSRNLALEVRAGEYVTFLDSDDLWGNDKLSIQVNSLSFDSYFTYMSYSIINFSGVHIKNYIPPPSVDYNKLLLGNCMGLLTVMLKSDFLGSAKFPHFGHEDYALWLTLLRKGVEASRVGGTTSYAQYRRHNSSLTSSKIRAASWQWKIYRVSEDFSLLRSSALMFSYAYKAFLKRL
jgi:teichuronic acid biosynthesis glycosyltransferase TuaG